MNRSFPSLHINLPKWVNPWVERQDPAGFRTIEGRMRLAIGLARENINAKTGGPFGAAIFNGKTHDLVAPGMNLVTSSQCSILHAEIVAIMLAQKIAGSFDLCQSGLPPMELVTSIAPCAMCLGAIPWSGVKNLVCGGRDEDAQSIGFDEGSKVDDWKGALLKRGVETIVDICREEAVEVLRSYAAGGGTIYNSNQK